MAKKRQRKNPQDATLRNVRAAKKRFAALDRLLTEIEKRLTALEKRYRS